MSLSRCESRWEQITALVTDELGSDAAAELIEHIETCGECAGLYAEMLREEAFLQDTFRKMARAVQQGPHSYAGRAERLSVAPATSQRRGTQKAHGWRRLARYSIAAIFVFGAAGLYSWFHADPSSGRAIAAVVEQVERARSVTYTRTLVVDGQETFVLHDAAIGAGRVRMEDNRGPVTIRNYADGSEILIDPTGKSAYLSHRIRHDRYRLSNYLAWIQTLHNTGELRGQASLEGRLTNVFSVESPFEHITVWTDTQTNLPVRVERTLSPSPRHDIRVSAIEMSLEDFADSSGKDSPSRVTGLYPHTVVAEVIPGVREETVTITLTDFAWNVDLDEALFDVKVPADYQFTEVDYGDPPQEEQALIASLRFWAEESGERLPSDINELLDSRPLLVKRFHKDGPAEKEFAEAVKMAYVVVQGSLFAQQKKSVDNWYYTSKSVSLGQADRPLCWWRVDGTSTYRVIYGDLSIRDLTSDDVLAKHMQ